MTYPMAIVILGLFAFLAFWTWLLTKRDEAKALLERLRHVEEDYVKNLETYVELSADVQQLQSRVKGLENARAFEKGGLFSPASPPR